MRDVRLRALLSDRELPRFAGGIGALGTTAEADRAHVMFVANPTPLVPGGHIVNCTLGGLPDCELLDRAHALVRRGLAIEAELLSHLGEVDARRLYLEQACSSMMFVYCVR